MSFMPPVESTFYRAHCKCEPGTADPTCLSVFELKKQADGVKLIIRDSFGDSAPSIVTIDTGDMLALATLMMRWASRQND